MKQMFTFHNRTRGKIHILKDKPCEDYSASFSEENGKYHIAIVADGHGSDECYRSAFGSKTAVEVALETLKKFAEAQLETTEMEERFYHDIFSNPRYQAMTIRQLTDAIISEWHDRVENDYEKNPPTEEELQKVELSENAEEKKESNISHVYGTTLIAALWLPKCLIIVHQGDGRCDVFYDDGTVDQPVPWDERCVDTAVTSMCDEDALTSIRHCVLNITEKKVIACYMGSDGVEDAYRDTYESVDGKMHTLMGGVHSFYKDLSCQLVTMTVEEFDMYLSEMLPEFSAYGRFSCTGSGDDVSVAGIVDIEAIRKYIPKFKQDIKVYDLEERLFWKEDELRGKMRKHGILRKRLNEAQMELEAAKIKLGSLEKQLKTWLAKRDALETQIEQTKQDIIKFKQECETAEQEQDFKDKRVERILRLISLSEIIARTRMQKQHDELQARSDKEQEKKNEYIAMIEEIRLKHEEALTLLQKAEEKFADAKSKFEEYDENYQRIDCERRVIADEIESVCNSATEVQ